MRESISISLPTPMRQRLDRFIRAGRLNRSDIVREALRQYFAREEFRRLRSLMVPEAEERGIFTDDDVFKHLK
ncbi:MAG: ribbon-helix-helix protein, CopG family [bacterium]